MRAMVMVRLVRVAATVVRTARHALCQRIHSRGHVVSENQNAPLPGERPERAVSAEFLERLRNAAGLLEELVANRDLLVGVPEEDRKRIAAAAGRVSRPDAIARRQVVKAAKRDRRAQKLNREEKVLAASG